MGSRVTIKDVAKLTGLSVGTISNYINGKVVSSANQTAIQAAIDNLGFRVNRFARGLRTSSSKSIAVITPDLKGFYISSVIAELEKNLMKKGYGIHLYDYRGNSEELMERLAHILEGNAEGVIYFPRLAMTPELESLFREFRNYEIPVIVASEILDGIESDSITVDYEKSIYDTCSMLCDFGHTKIALMTTSRPFATNSRVDGYRKALRTSNVDVDERLICKIGYTCSEALEATQCLLRERPGVTAVVTTGFRHKVGAIQAIHDDGKLVGREISFVGADCRDIAGICKNRLTYIDVCVQELARSLTELLLKRIDGDYEQFPQKLLVSTRLIAGNSVINIRNK
jgi:DNA-binding LacI/PurR family transcriptional regulator